MVWVINAVAKHLETKWLPTSGLLSTGFHIIFLSGFYAPAYGNGAVAYATGAVV